MSNNIEAYNNTLTAEERSENARRGGIASGEARRNRKSLKEELTLILEDDTIQHTIAMALVEKALDGNIKAFEVIRDTIGEKPGNAVEVTQVNSDSLKEFEAWLYGEETTA